MQYFTPELIVRGQSSDSQTLNEVEAAWDEACARYGAYLDSVRAEMPSGLRRVEESYYLHDAVIQSMGRRDGEFFIVLQLDTPPRTLLTLCYDLVAEPEIDRQALPAAVRTTGGWVEWQYDEIAQVHGGPATWRQSILLSNGWEVTLHFRDVQVQEAESLLPPQPALAVAD